jgi:predicted amidophosphoribosyltransferase
MTFRAGFWPAARIARLFRQLAASAADLVFPPSCLACRKAIEAPDALCPECWSSVRFIERPFCERLGTPFPVDLGAEGLLSPEAIANPPVYDRARAVAHFDDGPVRRLVHRLKYGDRLELTRAMGA